MKDAHLLRVLPEETDLDLDFAAGMLAASVGTVLCNLFAATCEVLPFHPILIVQPGGLACWWLSISARVDESECVLILVLFSWGIGFPAGFGASRAVGLAHSAYLASSNSPSRCRGCQVYCCLVVAFLYGLLPSGLPWGWG